MDTSVGLVCSAYITSMKTREGVDFPLEVRERLVTILLSFLTVL